MHVRAHARDQSVLCLEGAEQVVTRGDSGQVSGLITDGAGEQAGHLTHLGHLPSQVRWNQGLQVISSQRHHEHSHYLSLHNVHISCLEMDKAVNALLSV